MSDDSIADLSRPSGKSISRYGPSVSGPRSKPCPSLPVSSAFEAAAGSRVLQRLSAVDRWRYGDGHAVSRHLYRLQARTITTDWCSAVSPPDA
jgi:hypothetical protein